MATGRRDVRPEEKDQGNRRFLAVLKLGPLQSARDAVRAAIVQTYRDEVGDSL
jgi:hypothetical protein